MHLFVDISSHGFGHLAITAPILNALAQLDPDLQLTLRTRLPRQKLEQRIKPPFRLIEENSDFGYVMFDAIHIDLPASAAAYRSAHADWPGQVRNEAEFQHQLQPDLVLSNVSYRPLAAAKIVGIPALSVCSLNWADLFLHFFGNEAWAPPIYQQMLEAYQGAKAFLRMTPGMPMHSLGNTREIGPIATIGKKHDLSLGSNRAVLVALGGIGHHLPVDRWPHLPGIHWLIPSAWHSGQAQAIDAESFGLSFTDLLCSVDAIVSKPGYGIFTEAACNGTPVIYQRREDWPEQECLITWLHQHVAAQEVPAQALISGELGAALAALWQQVGRPRPVPDGALQAARLILQTAGLKS